MSRHASTRTTHRSAGHRGRTPLLAAALGIGIVLAGGATALAYWTATDVTKPVAAVADSLPAGATPTGAAATPNPRSSSVAVTFPQVITVGGRAPITGYLLTRYASGSQTGTDVGSSCVAGAAPATFVCTEAAVPDGLWTYTVTPSVGTNWRGDPSPRSGAVVVDTVPPAVAVTYPLASTTYGPTWAGAITGTASDPAGVVASVALTVRDTTANTYWAGSAWQSASTTVAAAGAFPGPAVPWTYALAPAALGSGHQYSVTATATDSVGNAATTAARTWGYSTTAPTVTLTSPTATTYGTSTWPGSISGTAVPQGTAVVIPAAGATTVEVQDATSGSWWSGAAWVGSAVQLPAGGSASWSFALDQAALTSGHSYATRARTTDSAGNVGSSAITTFAYFVPSKLAFVVQPATTTVNATIAPAVTVAVQDAAGHTAVGDGSTTLTLSVGAGPSGSTLLGGASRPVVAGVATFPGLALDKVGTGYRLLAVATSLTGATSGAFDMTPGPAAKVVFTTQPPATASSGTALTTQPVVTVQDSYGNTVTSSTAPVTLTTSGGTLACTANPRSAVAGVATFAGCALTGTGIRTLTAAASGLTPATSTSVTVGPVVAPPTNVNATKKGTSNRTIVKFTASSPTTGVANYTCSIYVNTGGTSTPNAGALIKAVSCTAGGDNNVLVGATYRGTNTIVVIVTANPRANYNGASSTPVVGNVG